MARLKPLGLFGLFALVVVAITAVVWSVSGLLGPVQNGHIPADFPHPFLAAADAGQPERVVLIRGRMAPLGPQVIDGVQRWPAWRCDHPACPGRSGDRPFIFAYGDPAQGASGVCPACAQVQGQDPTQIRPYLTPEGEAIIERVRAEF